MVPLPFNLALVDYLAGHRTPFLTDFFLAATTIGGFGGYFLIAMLIYVAWNKQLAIRLTVVVLFASSLNSLLKLAIKNPRPFIRQGTYLEKWAVSAKNAAQLATEYSTPSGHAMAASAFYSYLFALVRNRYIRIIAVLAILLIGASRPYLGVHYCEDVLLGWALGITLAVVSARYAEAIAAAWSRLSYPRQIAAAVIASLALWLFTAALDGWNFSGEARSCLVGAGFLTGIAIARPLELSRVNFDPASSSPLAKLLRFLLSVGMAAAALLLLDNFSAAIAPRASLPGDLLEYLRYAAVAFTSIFLAPLLFTRIGLAQRLAPSPHRL